MSVYRLKQPHPSRGEQRFPVLPGLAEDAYFLPATAAARLRLIPCKYGLAVERATWTTRGYAKLGRHSSKSLRNVTLMKEMRSILVPTGRSIRVSQVLQPYWHGASHYRGNPNG